MAPSVSITENCDHTELWHLWHCGHGKEEIASQPFKNLKNVDIETWTESPGGHRDPFFFFLFLLFTLLILGLIFKSCRKLCGAMCKKQTVLYNGGSLTSSHSHNHFHRFSHFDTPILPPPPAAIHITSRGRQIPGRGRGPTPRFLSSSLQAHRSLPPLYESQFDGGVGNVPVFRSHTYQRPSILPYGTFERRISEEDEGRMEGSPPIYTGHDQHPPPSYDEAVAVAVHGRGGVKF